MRFRETLWFKKGFLDAETAAECELDGDDTIDTLPIEDRYLDDGTLQAGDTLVYGLHTGTTQGLQRVHDAGDAVKPAAGVEEHVLIGEMKRGRRLYFAILAGAAAILGGSLVFIT